MVYTADVCDGNENARIADPIFKNFGGKKVFHGKIVTVKVFEDNSFVKSELEKDGHGKVLVVDGGASLRCALLGGNVAELAYNNGWEGVLIYGCIRDSHEVATFDVGVKAINISPKRSNKRNEGEINIPLHFAGVTFVPGHFLYADDDGVVVVENE